MSNMKVWEAVKEERAKHNRALKYIAEIVTECLERMGQTRQQEMDVLAQERVLLMAVLEASEAVLNDWQRADLLAAKTTVMDRFEALEQAILRARAQVGTEEA